MSMCLKKTSKAKARDDSHNRNLIAVGGKFWAAECCSLLARSDEGQKRSAADAEMIMAERRFN